MPRKNTGHTPHSSAILWKLQGDPAHMLGHYDGAAIHLYEANGGGYKVCFDCWPIKKTSSAENWNEVCEKIDEFYHDLNLTRHVSRQDSYRIVTGENAARIIRESLNPPPPTQALIDLMRRDAGLRIS